MSPPLERAAMNWEAMSARSRRGGEGGEGALVVFVEVVDAGVFEVEDADDVALVDEGDGELGAGLGVLGDVAGVFAGVGDEDGFAELGGGADDALAEDDGALAGDA